MDAAPAAVSLPARPPAQEGPLAEPHNFINRELSSLAFNERVLEEACDPSVPLLERLRFLAILSGNMDEFFMIRVAGLKQQISRPGQAPGPDAVRPARQPQLLSQRGH